MIRAAIWAAVSTETQAGPDKISLADQETRCRTTVQAKGWDEIAGPYIVPGESRTRYVDLSVAEQAIPPLHEMLNDATRKRFDVLVMYDYNRLRELLDPVARVLASYGVQIYSLNQPVEPANPESYNPNRADSAFLMQGISQIVSKAQIVDLRRKYEMGMPARVRERGLPAANIRFGYRKPPGRESDRSAVPVQDPSLVPLIVEFKDKCLAGWSIRQLVRLATLSGIKPPRGRKWYPQTIRDILRSPFYAGFNSWGMSKNFTDIRTGKRWRLRDIPLDEIVIAPGKHEPLWDEATHRALVVELDSRGSAYRGIKTSHLSRLLRCGQCGATLWMNHNGPRGDADRAVWRCSQDRTHPAAADHKVLENIGPALEKELAIQAEQYPEEPSPQAAQISIRQAELTELQARRRRLEDAYLAGGFEMTEYMRRAAELDGRITAAQQAIKDAAESVQSRQDRLALIGGILGAFEHVGTWLQSVDPQEANRMLRLLLDHVVVGRDGAIKELVFR